MSDFLSTQRTIFKDGTFNLNPSTGGINVPEWAFKPDEWTVAFLRGLTKIAVGWEGKRVWEVGVCTGINLVVLRNLAPSAQWYFSDYNTRCVSLALENLRLFNEDLKRFHPLTGSWDLVTPPDGGRLPSPKVDVIFGCLPQVPAEINLAIGDRIAHYYDPRHYPEAHLNALGLGLNEALLRRAKGVLRSRGMVALNLSGRPGLQRLHLLFQETGYHSEVIYQTTIPQHPETSLASLAALEGSGQSDFEFFTDASCASPLNARDAETRRQAGKSVFHNIYVIAGTLT